jgi:hypothetical protein
MLRYCFGFAAALALGLVAVPSAPAVPQGSTVLVDVPSGLGALPFGGNGFTTTTRHALSADGCLVVFQSAADDVLAGDEDSAVNVYRVDRCNPGIPPVQVNTTAAGQPAQAGSFSSEATISANGRYVAFQTNATNLEPSVTGH